MRYIAGGSARTEQGREVLNMQKKLREASRELMELAQQIEASVELDLAPEGWLFRIKCIQMHLEAPNEQ